jgi:hypothetical protein
MMTSTSKVVGVSTAVHHDEPIRFYPPEEALRRARPLPDRESLRIEGLTDEERTAFLEAIAAQ